MSRSGCWRCRRGWGNHRNRWFRWSRCGGPRLWWGVRRLRRLRNHWLWFGQRTRRSAVGLISLAGRGAAIVLDRWRGTVVVLDRWRSTVVVLDRWRGTVVVLGRRRSRVRTGCWRIGRLGCRTGRVSWRLRVITITGRWWIGPGLWSRWCAAGGIRIARRGGISRGILTRHQWIILRRGRRLAVSRLRIGVRHGLPDAVIHDGRPGDWFLGGGLRLRKGHIRATSHPNGQGQNP